MKLSLRSWRLAREKSQEEMAKMLGVCRDTYVSWENEPSKISISNGQKIADFLQISIDDIIFFTTNSTKCSESK